MSYDNKWWQREHRVHTVVVFLWWSNHVSYIQVSDISESFFENLPLSQCVPLSAPALHGQALRNVGGQLARQTYLRANKDLLLPYCTHWGDRKIKDPADKVAVSEIHKMYTIIVLKRTYWLQSMYTAKWMTLNFWQKDGWTDRWMDKDRQTDRQIHH